MTGQKMHAADRDEIPGRVGCLWFQQNCETLKDTMPEWSRAARRETIGRYDRLADAKFLGRFQADFNSSCEVPGGDLKFTKKNALDLLSNTLGASKAEHHREVRNSTLHCGTHPWDIKTTIFSFPRPETSHGWDPDTKVDRSLQTLVHNTTLDKAFHNTSRKGEKYFTSYKTLQQQFSGHHDQEREAKRVLRAELSRPKDAACTGMVLVKARSKTFRADVAAVGALPYMETTPKAAVNPGEEGEGGDDVEGTMRDMLPAPGGNQAQQ